MKRLKLVFAWYDLRVGLYYDKKKKWLYILLLPTIGMAIVLNPFHNWMEELKQIAFKWSSVQYPLDSKWAIEFWKKSYKKGLTPQETWNDYVTMID
jgi:hypothetical protein